jgi:hypothetical protein
LDPLPPSDLRELAKAHLDRIQSELLARGIAAKLGW